MIIMVGATGITAASAAAASDSTAAFALFPMAIGLLSAFVAYGRA